MKERDEAKMITAKMKRDVASYHKVFNKETEYYNTMDFFNGFFGVGVLKKPIPHKNIRGEIIGTDDIWIYSIGFNKNCSRIIELESTNVQLWEAKLMYKCLGKAIRKYQIVKKRARNK